MEENFIKVQGNGAIHVVPDVTRLELKLESIHESYQEAYAQMKDNVDTLSQIMAEVDLATTLPKTIAMLGVKGIDPNKSGYRVDSLDKTFGGYELLAYYYVSWAIAIPEKLEVLHLPFSEAYRLARQMFDGGKNSQNRSY